MTILNLDVRKMKTEIKICRLNRFLKRWPILMACQPLWGYLMPKVYLYTPKFIFTFFVIS